MKDIEHSPPLSEGEAAMHRALQLAALGHGHVSPNPLVGCVIVHNDIIIGEGWHKKYGEAHAEVNAIDDVEQRFGLERANELLAQSTAYVTLEPCSHFGKTPPCADLLVKKRLKKVVICNTDPFEAVNGRGIEKLQAVGIEVITGILTDEGRKLNARFFTKIEKKRPYIILKWAETADGFIAKEDGKPLTISCLLSRTLSHKWRTEEDAIMIGTNTAINDNPRLNARLWKGRNPVRIVIDRHNRLPKDLHLFDGTQETIIPLPPTPSPVREGENLNKLPSLTVEGLGEGFNSILVEGGAKLLQSFIDQDLWDEIRIFKSPNSIGKGIAAPVLKQHYNAHIQQIGIDKLWTIVK